MAHGKTLADVGAIYLNGGIEYVLIEVTDVDTLHITQRAGNGHIARGTQTLAYVSGGYNTADISVTASSLRQWFPPYTNYSLRLYIDDVEHMETNGTFSFNNNVKFVETYGLLHKADIVAWFEANGASGDIIPTGTPAVWVSNSYVYDAQGRVIIYHDVQVGANAVAYDDIMFEQCGKMRAADTKYYVPTALPFTHEGQAFDFANIDNPYTDANGTNGTGWTGRMNFTPDRVEATGIACDRVVQLSASGAGFVSGLLPILVAAPDVRRENTIVKSLQFSTLGAKIYHSAHDTGAATLPAWSKVSGVSYRMMLPPPRNETCNYVVPGNGKYYWYLDFHTDGDKHITVPQELAGKEFVEIGSKDITLHSQALMGNISLTVTTGATNAHLVLEVG